MSQMARIFMYLTILERAEPEQHKVQVVLSGIMDHFVQLRKVKLALFQLNHLPRDASQDRVYVSSYELWPYLAHILSRGER